MSPLHGCLCTCVFMCVCVRCACVYPLSADTRSWLFHRRPCMGAWVRVCLCVCFCCVRACVYPLSVDTHSWLFHRRPCMGAWVRVCLCVCICCVRACACIHFLLTHAPGASIAAHAWVPGSVWVYVCVFVVYTRVCVSTFC